MNKKCMITLLLLFLISTHALAESEIQSISPDKIKSYAHDVMTEIYSYDVTVADSFEYVVEETNSGIEVYVYPFPETDDHFLITYQKDGSLLNCSIPDILDLRAFSKMVYETHRTFFMFTLEEKAAFSEEYIPKVEATLRLDPNYAGMLYDYTRSRYGLPQDGDLTQEKALEIAKQASMDLLGLDADWFDDNFWYYTFFDITDPECTLWKFYFANSRPGKGKYVIRLNSKTGEVVKAFKYNGRNLPLWEAL